MIRAYHVIFSAYGFWLPNDPRGSWSDFVRAWHVRRFGPATKVTTPCSLAAKPHDHHARHQAKRALRYSPVHFTGRQAQLIGQGFHRAVEESGYHVFAGSILPEHVHVVFGRHEQGVERVVGHLKTKGTLEMATAGEHPFRAMRLADGRLPTAWGRSGWKVYLNDDAGVRRAIQYVEENPIKEGKRPQRWSFVTEYRL